MLVVVRLVNWIVLAPILAACSGPAPDPARMAEDLPAARDLDPAERAFVVQQTTIALDALRADDVAAARVAADDVLRVDPRAGLARAILAACLAAAAAVETPPVLALWREAEGEFRRAERLAPDDPVVGLLHARFLRDDGHLSSAAERLVSVLADAPDDVEALRLQATLRYDLGEEQRAIPVLERLRRLRPDDAEVVWRLAQSHARTADAERDAGVRRESLESAAVAFADYAVLAPDDPDGPLGEAHVRLVLLQESGETLDAIAIEPLLALYERAAELAPGSAEPHFARGVAQLAIGVDGAAREAWRGALAVDGSHVPSLLDLAASLAADGQRAEAEVYALRALESGVTADERRRIEAWLRDGQPHPW